MSRTKKAPPHYSGDFDAWWAEASTHLKDSGDVAKASHCLAWEAGRNPVLAEMRDADRLRAAAMQRAREKASSERMVTCTRRLEWDALHRIPKHEGACRALHGHRYAAELTFSGDLDGVGRVLEFATIKEDLGSWIQNHWDHTAILQEGDNDPACAAIARTNEGLGKPVYLMRYPPTVEHLAVELAERVVPAVLPTARLVRVRLWETPNCSATWETS